MSMSKTGRAGSNMSSGIIVDLTCRYWERKEWQDLSQSDLEADASVALFGML